MKFHYDLSLAEPIVKDLRIYDAAGGLGVGTVLEAGAVATAENCGCAIIAQPTVCQNIIGVLNETLTAAECLGVVATGVDKYGKVIVNPLAVWLGEYSQLAADDTPTSTTTQKILTGTCVTDHERGWAYVTGVGSAVGGRGNLFQIGASGTTATITAATDYDDNMTATVNGDTFIVLPAPFTADVAGGGVDLAAYSINLSGYAGTGSGSILISENYIESKNRPMEPLVAAKHSGKNLWNESPHFYGDATFPEHLFLGGAVCDRPIT